LIRSPFSEKKKKRGEKTRKGENPRPIGEKRGREGPRFKLNRKGNKDY